MVENVVKRNGNIEPFDKEKIVQAVTKAMNNLGVQEDDIPTKVARRVTTKLKKSQSVIPRVDEIHVLVENTLMDMKEYELAREYITYRNQHKPDIFRPRVEIKPYEYPELIEYLEAIRHSYWIHTEYNYMPDIQDMKVTLTEKERSVVTRAMLAISQIESKVKKFWSDVDKRLPKPEVAKVGATFAESEVRHEDAYSHLIEILGLNGEFKTLVEDVPAIKKRIKYLEKVNSNNNALDPRDYFESIILFSMFIENVSLFSQFLIIMSFNKHQNTLKGMSNAVEATSKEENIHAMFGFDLVNIIKEENPNWWTEELVEDIIELAHEAYDAEMEVVDWMYELGDISIAPKELTKEYIKQRLNESLLAIGIDEIFEVDRFKLSAAEWFDDEIKLTKNGDFFNKRQVAYTKRNNSVTVDELF